MPPEDKKAEPKQAPAKAFETLATYEGAGDQLEIEGELLPKGQAVPVSGKLLTALAQRSDTTITKKEKS